MMMTLLGFPGGISLGDWSVAEVKSVIDRIHHYLSGCGDDLFVVRRGHDGDAARPARKIDRS